jgi:hypothetical protein
MACWLRRWGTGTPAIEAERDFVEVEVKMTVLDAAD